MPNLKTGLALLETGGGVERKRRRPLRAGHQHDHVAIDLPCRRDGRWQDLLAKASPSEGRVSYDILDQSVRLPAAGQIGNDEEAANTRPQASPADDSFKRNQ
jgi:hypothetical protein